MVGAKGATQRIRLTVLGFGALYEGPFTNPAKASIILCLLEYEAV